METKVKMGLLPLPKDDRDIKLGALYTYPKLSEIPNDFELPILGIKNQLDSDFCTGYATCLISEMQEDVSLEPSYSFALSKEISGNKDEYGQDLRTAMKSHVKFGAIETKYAPFSLETRSPDFLRDIKNWQADLKMSALYHKKMSFVQVA